MCLGAAWMSCLFQSTLPTRGSDDKEFYICPREDFVSIHAPHEGERPFLSSILPDKIKVSIHAPHEGERPVLRFMFLRGYCVFQSTLPTRGSDGGKVHLYAAFPRIY